MPRASKTGRTWTLPQRDPPPRVRMRDTKATDAPRSTAPRAASKEWRVRRPYPATSRPPCRRPANPEPLHQPDAHARIPSFARLTTTSVAFSASIRYCASDSISASRASRSAVTSWERMVSASAEGKARMRNQALAGTTYSSNSTGCWVRRASQRDSNTIPSPRELLPHAPADQVLRSAPTRRAPASFRNVRRRPDRPRTGRRPPDRRGRAGHNE